MANEKRLIDANALIEQMQFRREVTDAYLQAVRDCVMIGRSLVMKAPTVDAVEVVRCKDCKHWKIIDSLNPHWECQIFYGLHEYGYPTNADDFCSYGERREGE